MAGQRDSSLSCRQQSRKSSQKDVVHISAEHTLNPGQGRFVLVFNVEVRSPLVLLLTQREERNPAQNLKFSIHAQVVEIKLILSLVDGRLVHPHKVFKIRMMLVGCLTQA